MLFRYLNNGTVLQNPDLEAVCTVMQDLDESHKRSEGDYRPWTQHLGCFRLWL